LKTFDITTEITGDVSIYMVQGLTSLGEGKKNTPPQFKTDMVKFKI